MKTMINQLNENTTIICSKRNIDKEKSKHKYVTECMRQLLHRIKYSRFFYEG